MFVKLEKSEEMVFGLSAGDMFLEGECSSWSEGEGIFFWEPFSEDPVIIVFENNNSYRCYEVTAAVDFMDVILAET